MAPTELLIRAQIPNDPSLTASPHINIGPQDYALPLSECDPVPLTMPCLITVLPLEFVIFTPTHTLHTFKEQVSHNTNPDYIVIKLSPCLPIKQSGQQMQHMVIKSGLLLHM